MKYGMRERIIGGIILVALAVILVPMFFGSPSQRESEQAPSMTINQQPIEVPQREIAPPQSELAPTPEHGSAPAAEVSHHAQLLPQTAPSSGHGEALEPGAVAATEAARPPAAPAPQRPASPQAQAEPSHPASPPQAQAEPSHPASPPPQAQAEPSRPAPPPPQAQAEPPRRAEPSAGPASDSLASSDPIMAAANRHRGDGGAGAASNGQSAAAAAPASGNWSVQAGSFGQSANADRLIEQLRGLGFEAYKITRGANSVVMVGPFASSQAGESARQQLQQRANINGFVVRNNGSAG